jgi:hypothetical protein
VQIVELDRLDEIGFRLAAGCAADGLRPVGEVAGAGTPLRERQSEICLRGAIRLRDHFRVAETDERTKTSRAKRIVPSAGDIVPLRAAPCEPADVDDGNA